MGRHREFDGVLTVNGHSYKDKAKQSDNSNFALLSSTNFTEPFDQPVEYARYIASLANKISGGYVLVQRLGDLEKGRRTTVSRLEAVFRETDIECSSGRSLIMYAEETAGQHH